MFCNILHISSILSIVGCIVAFPTSVDEFYQTLHRQLRPKEGTDTDACQKIANKGVVKYQQAVDCYNSFPLEDSVRLDTLDSLKKTLEFYVFKDIVARSPDDNVPSENDIDTEWTELMNYRFNTEFEFNSFLKGYFNTLHDGHTAYESNCYNKFEFKQPFPIYIQGPEVRILTKIEFADGFIDKWLELGLDVKKYEGSQILKINNMKPMKYMKLYSHFYIGISRDVNSRLNLGSARVVREGWEYGINHGMFTNSLLVPLNSTVTYSLKTPDGEIHKVVAPYLAKSPKEFTNSESYYLKYCNPQVVKRPGSNNAAYGASVVKNAPINQNLIKSKRSKRDIDLKVLERGPNLDSYLIRGKIGVLVISDFHDETETLEYNLGDAFSEFKKNNVKKLILDLSNNYGGNMCIGYNFLHGLFPGAKQYPTDMRSTPLLRESTSKEVFELSPKSYDKPDGTPFQSSQAFKTQKTYSRGKKNQAHFTPKFVDRCPEIWQPLPITFPPKDIIVVTNTLCYSTCSLVVNSLQQLYNVTTFALGGDLSLPAPLASVVGGGALPFSHFRGLLRAGNEYPEQLPGTLPGHVKFGLTFREAYSHNHTNRPLEFTFIPAKHRLPYDETTINHPKFVWDSIAKKLADNILL